jgi:hypothetical protein
MRLAEARFPPVFLVVVPAGFLTVSLVFTSDVVSR